MQEMMKTTDIPLNDINKTESLSEEWKKCCRICHSEKGRLLTVCECKGSLAFVHEKCQMDWLLVKGSLNCEICGTELNVKLVYKDFFDWISLRDNVFRKYLYFNIVFKICAQILISVFLWTISVLSISSILCVVVVTLLLYLIPLTFLGVGFRVWHIFCLNSYYEWRQNQYKYVLRKTKANTPVDPLN